MKNHNLKEDKYRLALYFLEQKLGRHHTINNPDEDYRFLCPKCKHQNAKLVVTFKNKEYPNGCYHCWTCGDGGNSIYQLFYNLFPTNHPLFREIFECAEEDVRPTIENTQKQDLLQKLHRFSLSASDIIDKEYLSGIILPPEFTKYGNATYEQIYTEGFTYLINYLTGRGITLEDIIKYDIHFNINNKQLLFPSYGINGKLNHYIIHSPLFKRYTLGNVKKEQIIWNELHINWSKPVVIVEGVYDAITVGDNAIPILGSTLSDKFALFKKIIRHKTPIEIGLDMDVSDEYKYNLAMMFNKHGVDASLLRWKGKDANETGKLQIEGVRKNKQKINWQQAILKKKLSK